MDYSTEALLAEIEEIRKMLGECADELLHVMRSGAKIDRAEERADVYRRASIVFNRAKKSDELLRIRTGRNEEEQGR